MTQPRNVLDLNKKRSASGSAPVPIRKPAAASRKPLRTSAAQLEERQARSRARRRKLRMIVLPFLIILLAGAAYGVHYASYLPQFRISTIQVQGAQDVSPSLIRALVVSRLDDGSHPFIARDNLFMLDTAKLSAEIVGFFPRIRVAHVSRSLAAAGVLTVSVEEREPYARWCADPAQADCYVMDDGGFIYAPVSALASSTASTTALAPATSYIFGGGIDATSSPVGSRFATAHLPGIVAFLKGLGDEGFVVRGATLQGDDDFMVQLQDGFVLMASFGQNAADLGRNLRLVLGSDDLSGRAKDLEYVDLRFGNRVYYKLRGEKQTASSTASR